MQSLSVRPAVFINRIRHDDLPNRLRSARALFDAFQTDKFELLSGPDVEYALASVPVAGKYHRMSFCDIQHAVGGKPGIDVQRVPVQFSLRSLCISSNPKQHHADGQEQQTSVRCKWLHSSLKYHHSLSYHHLSKPQHTRGKTHR